MAADRGLILAQGATLPRSPLQPDIRSTEGMWIGLGIVAALVAVTLLILWLVDRRAKHRRKPDGR